MENGLKLIVAIGKDGAIGKEGNLIWRIPEDLKRFKSLTMGHTVVMGRKTWESLPKRPLPGRRNILLTRKNDYSAEGAEIVNTPEEALNAIRGEEAFVIGGAEVYKVFMPYVTELNLTLVEDDCQDADAFLRIAPEDWSLEEETEPYATEEGINYKYVTYKRKR